MVINDHPRRAHWSEPTPDPGIRRSAAVIANRKRRNLPAPARISGDCFVAALLTMTAGACHASTIPGTSAGMMRIPADIATLWRYDFVMAPSQGWEP